MEKIIRGLIQINETPDKEEAYKNWIRLHEHNLDFMMSEDAGIYAYLKMFYDQMSSPPDFDLVVEYFEKNENENVLERLEEIKRTKAYIGTNYLAIVRAEENEQNKTSLVNLLKNAMVITESGKNISRKVVLKGVNDAVNYMFDNLHDFTKIENGEKLEGIISEDAAEVIEEYNLVESTDQFATRNLFGLEPVDSVCKGHRRGEYWIHTAYAGELKTTVSLNYAYNNSMLYGRNIFYAILEMPYTQLRRMLYVIHSSHGKFVTDWYDEDRKNGVKPENRYLGVDYRRVRDGELSPLEKKRFIKVAQDYEANSKGKLFIWRPQMEVTMKDIRQKAEMFHNKYGCDGVIIDHMGLVKPTGRVSDYVVSLNSIVREGKLMSLGFARGRGVPVLSLFQMNRQGKMRADKNEGRYDMAAISYANEVEKSADVITWTYLNDELRKDGKFYMGNLKNRDNPLFDRLVGKIIWQSKRIRAIEQSMIDTSTDNIRNISDKIRRISFDI